MDIVKSIVDLVDNVEIDLDTLFSIGGLNRALWCFNEVLLSPNMKVSKCVPFRGWGRCGSVYVFRSVKGKVSF